MVSDFTFQKTKLFAFDIFPIDWFKMFLILSLFFFYRIIKKSSQNWFVLNKSQTEEQKFQVYLRIFVAEKSLGKFFTAFYELIPARNQSL